MISISAGTFCSFALRADGSIAAWGSKQHIPKGNDFVAVAGGDYHSLAIRSDGTLAGWGSNDYGQIDVPTGTFTAASGAWRHSLAIRSDGTLVGWGDDDGQTDIPTGTFVAIAAGFTHNLALRADGSVVAWGNNEFEQTDVPAGLLARVAPHDLVIRTEWATEEAKLRRRRDNAMRKALGFD